MTKFNLTNTLQYLHNYIKSINDSKIFAGIMIITLNIVSRFVDIKLSKSMESFLKYTYSKYILVFTIAWMGTRDIYIALGIMFLYIISIDFLLEDDSMFCILPEGFKQYHNEIEEINEENKEVSEEEVKKAEKVLERANKQKQKHNNYEIFVVK